MPQCEKMLRNNHGAILISVLIMVAVVMVLLMATLTNTLLETKMQNATNQATDTFLYAELMLQETIFEKLGEPFDLPDSLIKTTVTVNPISTDHCGNQIDQITITASKGLSTVVLNSLNFFATVPKRKNCRRRPRHQCLYWDIEGK